MPPNILNARRRLSMPGVPSLTPLTSPKQHTWNHKLGGLVLVLCLFSSMILLNLKSLFLDRDSNIIPVFLSSLGCRATKQNK